MIFNLYVTHAWRKDTALERDQFNDVFAAHYVRVLRFVERRVDDAGVAEEIAAETFFVAWARRDQVEISVPWLYRTAINKIGDHYKRSQRKRAAEAALLRRAEAGSEVLSPLDRLALAAALTALTPREREIVMLTYWEGLSAREVAQVVAASESSIWVALNRARAKMRTHLDGASIPPGGAHASR